MRACFLFGLLLSILLLSCIKDDTGTVIGRASALKFTAPWEATVISTSNDSADAYFNLEFKRRAPDGVLLEAIHVFNIPKKLMRHRLFPVDSLRLADTSRQMAGYIRMNADSICDRYNVVESDSTGNFLQVDTYHVNSGTIKGVFSLRLAVQLPKCSQLAPDTLIFQNGVFYSRLD